MFSVAPKQVEISTPKKGRKNKEIAFEHFEKSVEKIENLVVTIENITKLETVTDMRKQLKSSLKEVKEVKKLLQKYKNIQYKPKRTRESHNTGLEKLRPISENMALFAGWEYGVTQKSRYDITNTLCAYIKEHDLRDPENKTIILPDAKLQKLLQVDKDVVLKYPTMQKYLKNCFEEIVEEPVVVEEKEVKRGRKPKEPVVVAKVVEEPVKTKKSILKKEAPKDKETTKAKKETKSKK